MFKEENANKLKDFLFRVDPILSDHVFLKSELIDRRRTIYKAHKVLFNRKKNLFITGPSGIGKTTFALQYRKYLFDNNLIDSVVFWQSNYFFKIQLSFKKLNKTLGSAHSEKILENLKKNFESNKKKYLFIFDNVDDFENIDEYINCLSELENTKILILSDSFNKENVNNPLYEKFEQIKLPEFNKEDAEDHINTQLDFFKKEDRDQVINTLFNDNKLISGLKLDLILKYAKKEEFENNLENFFKILNNNTDTIIIQEVLKQFDYQSLQLKLLKIIQYLDYSFISFQCLTYLSDIPVKIISEYVTMFEKKGILNHLFKYDLEGVSLNKRTVDELRNNFKDDSYLFRSVFSKIEKWLLYQTVDIKIDVFNVDLEFYYHFLENFKLLKSESFYEDYKDRIDQIIEKIEAVESSLNENDKVDVISVDSMKVDREAQKDMIELQENKLNSEPTIENENETNQSSYYDQGVIFFEKGEYQNATVFFEKSLKKKENEPKDQSELFYKLAISYLTIGDDKNAIKYFGKCLETNDSPYKIQEEKFEYLLNALGTAFSNFGENDKAINAFKNSLKLNLNGDITSFTYFSMAKCYYYKGKLEDAQECINKSLELLEKSQNEWSLANANIIEASIIYKVDKNNVSRAIVKCQASLEILKKLNEDQNRLYRAHYIANAYKYLGKFFLAKGDVYNSIKHLKKGKSTMKKELLSKHPLYAKILHNLGVAFLKNGNELLSKKYLEQSLELCKRILPESHPITISVMSDLENIVSTDK
jgi:tetratricopeptide (TPR) repeat protein